MMVFQKGDKVIRLPDSLHVAGGAFSMRCREFGIDPLKTVFTVEAFGLGALYLKELSGMWDPIYFSCAVLDTPLEDFL